MKKLLLFSVFVLLTSVSSAENGFDVISFPERFLEQDINVKVSVHSVVKTKLNKRPVFNIRINSGSVTSEHYYPEFTKANVDKLCVFANEKQAKSLNDILFKEIQIKLRIVRVSTKDGFLYHGFVQ